MALARHAQPRTNHQTWVVLRLCFLHIQDPTNDRLNFSINSQYGADEPLPGHHCRNVLERHQPSRTCCLAKEQAIICRLVRITVGTPRHCQLQTMYACRRNGHLACFISERSHPIAPVSHRYYFPHKKETPGLLFMRWRPPSNSFECI